MILASHGIVASQIASFDADAVAFFNRVTTAGGSLTTTEKNATNQLVLDLKSAGIWSSMKAIYPMVGASAAACAQNLKSSSFTGTFTSGWTFASTGVTGNGTSAYFDTTFNPNTQLTINSVHMSYYSRTQLAVTINQPMRVTDGTNDMQLSPNVNFSSFSFRVTAGGTSAATTTNTDCRGFFIGSRTASNLIKGYKNNTTLATDTTSGTNTLPNFNLYLGAANNAGSAANYSILENSFASIGDGLTDTQASNFYTAVQAFQTTLSRQV
jgi:hypothetical protein